MAPSAPTMAREQEIVQYLELGHFIPDGRADERDPPRAVENGVVLGGVLYDIGVIVTAMQYRTANADLKGILETNVGVVRSGRATRSSIADALLSFPHLPGEFNARIQALLDS